MPLTLNDFQFTRSGRELKYDVDTWLDGGTHVLRQATILSEDPVLDDDGNPITLKGGKAKVKYTFDENDPEADFFCTMQSLKASLNATANKKGGGLNAKVNGAMGMTATDPDGNEFKVDFPHLVVSYSEEPLRVRTDSKNFPNPT